MSNPFDNEPDPYYEKQRKQWNYKPERKFIPKDKSAREYKAIIEDLKAQIETLEGQVGDLQVQIHNLEK